MFLIGGGKRILAGRGAEIRRIQGVRGLYSKPLAFARKLHTIQLSSINMQFSTTSNANEDLLVDTLRMRHELPDIADRRGKIARMINSGELISLRRGLYARRRNIDALGLAGPIYGPSYVSFETALAKHGMIPESVIETISATTKRGALFTNDFGRFRYIPVPKAVYPVGVCLVTSSDVPFLIASPTKALCDRIACEGGFRSLADVDHWLKDMRVDFETKLDPSELKMCAGSYGRSSVRLLHQFALKKGYTE